jgi:stress-induced morphogen
MDKGAFVMAIDIANQNKKITPETVEAEQKLGAHFAKVDAYRFNSVSLRIRIIDEKFRGLSKVDRAEMVEPILDQLPESIQQDIVFLLLMAPGEESEFSYSLMNHEFDNPRRSQL